LEAGVEPTRRSILLRGGGSCSRHQSRFHTLMR